MTGLKFTLALSDPLWRKRHAHGPLEATSRTLEQFLTILHKCPMKYVMFSFRKVASIFETLHRIHCCNLLNRKACKIMNRTITDISEEWEQALLTYFSHFGFSFALWSRQSSYLLAELISAKLFWMTSRRSWEERVLRPVVFRLLLVISLSINSSWLRV